ncbi:MAG: hypothetical protein ACTSRI_18050 [Promethearchaeota archaeon]
MDSCGIKNSSFRLITTVWKYSANPRNPRITDSSSSNLKTTLASGLPPKLTLSYTLSSMSGILSSFTIS